MSRRSVLIGAASSLAGLGGLGAAVEADLLPGRSAAHRLLGLNGPDGTVPDVAIGTVAFTTFDSSARQRPVTYAVSTPPGRVPRSLPVVLALHGLGGACRTGMTLGLPEFQAAAIDRGVPAFAVVTVDAGNGYYHPHGGDDAGAMIIDELLPRLAEAGLATDRIAIYGWSMGGYGALRIAGLLGSPHVAAVAAVSPALWQRAQDASRSGFANASEYSRFSVMDRQHELDRIGVRLEVGDGDPFRNATRAYARGFAPGAATITVSPGGHNDGYWRRMLPGDMSFLGRSLAR